MANKDQHQEPGASQTGAAGNGSRPPSSNQGRGTRKATGPRTAIGKRRSSQNAIKSGIFSRVTLLEGESRAEYESLRKGLWKSKPPGDEFEEILLDKMVSNLWRQRRVLIAEGAEIRRESEFVEFDRRQKELEEAEEISRECYPATRPTFIPEPVGLIWSIENPDVLERCIEILAELRQRIVSKGFDEEQDWGLLRTIYGDPAKSHLRQTLHDEYSIWLGTAQATEEERTREGYPIPAQCTQNVLRAIGAEINRLNQYKEKHDSVESERRKVEILRQRVPDSSGLDRLLRYQSSLERAFDRTLTQLERAQRTRKGQPMPAQVDVKIS